MVRADDHEGAELFVDHRERAVLQLTAHDALAVHVRELLKPNMNIEACKQSNLDLEGALQAGSEVVAAAHDEHRLLLVDLLRNLQHLRVQFEHLTDVV